MQVFDAAAVRAALPFDRLVAALQSLFASGCEVPPRHVHEVATGEGGHFTSLIMPAWLTGRYYGIKTINIAPGNAAHGLPGLHASYLLFDGVTGVPLAVMDGNETHRAPHRGGVRAGGTLAGARAGAAPAGGGRRPRGALAAARLIARSAPIERVSIWARSGDQGRGAGRAVASGGNATRMPWPTWHAACAEADIVSCATLATAPVVHGAWLQPGNHLDLIGSFTPAMREADDACFTARRSTSTRAEAMNKSGDLLGPMSRGVIAADEVRGTLAGLSREAEVGRGSAGGAHRVQVGGDCAGGPGRGHPRLREPRRLSAAARRFRRLAPCRLRWPGKPGARLPSPRPLRLASPR